MADIELVIKIPEEIYDGYMNYTENYVDFMFFGTEEKIVRAIRNGTPIPDNATNGDIYQIRAELYEDYESYSASEVNFDFACGIKRAIDTIDYHINHNLNRTNGSVISEVFPNAKIVETEREVFLYTGTREKDKDIQIFDTEWWNSPYQKGGKE